MIKFALIVTFTLSGMISCGKGSSSQEISYKPLSNLEAKKWVRGNNALVVYIHDRDADTGVEWVGQYNIPYSNFEDALNEVPFHPESPLLLVSDDISRAYVVQEWLNKKGFRQVRISEASYLAFNQK